MINILLLQAYFHVFLVIVLTLKTFLKRGSVASRTLHIPFCGVASCFAEQKRLMGPGILWAFSAVVALCPFAMRNCIVLTDPWTSQRRLKGQNGGRGWGCLNWTACRPAGSPAPTSALCSWRGRLPEWRRGHGETTDVSLRRCRSTYLLLTLPFASGPFGSQGAQLATPSLGKPPVQLAARDWVCFLISSNLHLSKNPAGWYFQILNGGGKEGQPYG